MKKDVKMRILVAAALVASMLLIWGVREGCAAGRPHVIARGSGAVRWGKDSQSLYYLSSMLHIDTLYRYDLVTEKQRTYRGLPEFATIYDIAPDGKTIVSIGENAISLTIIDLEQRTARTTYDSPAPIYSERYNGALMNGLQSVEWLPQNQILFTQQTADLYSDAYLINPDGTGLHKVREGVSRLMCAGDGSGFVYMGVDHRWHHFTLATLEDRVLFPNDPIDAVTYGPNYLSQTEFICRKHYGTTDSRVTERVDLRTLQVSVIAEESPKFYADGISPDGRWGYFLQPGTDFLWWPTKSKLWLVELSKEAH